MDIHVHNNHIHRHIDVYATVIHAPEVQHNEYDCRGHESERAETDSEADTNAREVCACGGFGGGLIGERLPEVCDE